MECINVTAASNDLDVKVNAILSVIVQDDGDSFAKRAEMYYQQRPQLIEMIEDLRKTCRCLADKYDQLRSQLNSLSPVSRVRGNGSVQDHDLEDELVVYDVLNAQAANRDSIENLKMTPDCESCGEKMNVINGIGFQRNTSDGYKDAMLEHEKVWNELRFKVSELVEDNLSHQAELIRRNDAKRETIRDLCSKMNMKDENKTMNGNHRVTRKTQSQVSRLKWIFLGKFMK
ncbi:putative RNA polymerase II C-terminal domain phosphatase-like 3 [Hibiscus syriacus]|uniref:RNA polymerase II C-terminal domain phosphatase-like 3 n=1 Tax=Hibiscus syriacus TaxID=106335 RepID=A0A6A2X599_HIBSY|nr:protein NETWORKED 3A-like [Hibiscus syriacus]KAE8670151.1 putative RNA polymerase II C-terminal domain phosphatase-like 3 [Hibiscus syriacus]